MVHKVHGYILPQCCSGSFDRRTWVSSCIFFCLTLFYPPVSCCRYASAAVAT